MLFPKQKRIRDKKHLEFIRILPCIRCQRTPSDPHHIRIGSGSGIGIKPSDDRCVPLCNDHHRKLHDSGEITFLGDVGKTILLASSLHKVSGNREEAIRLIKDAQL